MLNLEKTIFKPENETIYFTNDHLRLLNLWSTVSKNWKTFAQEGKGRTSRSKQREGQREIATFCSIICEFSILLSYFLQ